MIALHGRLILSLIDGWGGRNCHNPFTSFHDLKANEMHQIWRKSGQEIWGKQGRICQHPSPSSKSIVQKCMKCRFSITLESTSMKCPPPHIPTHTTPSHPRRKFSSERIFSETIKSQPWIFFDPQCAYCACPTYFQPFWILHRMVFNVYWN